MLLNAGTLQEHFERGLPFHEFVATGDSLGHRAPWDQRFSQLELDQDQRALVEAFDREMNVLCMTGTWCGDCALQGAAMARVAEANSAKINLRYIPRSEEFAEVVVASQLNAGFRVPMTWFLAEDFEPVAMFGDRTLGRYRAMARKQLAPEEVAMLAPPPSDPVREVLREVIDEFERVHLLLRLSPRLRQKHSD